MISGVIRGPLASLFLDCYNLAVNKWGTVKNHMRRSSSFCSWNIHPRRNLNDLETEEMGRLLELMDCYSLGGVDLPDEMIWILDEKNRFSVKSKYKVLAPSNKTFSRGVCLESRNSNQCFFSFLLWELWWNRVPMIDNLIRRGLIIPNWCCLCVADAKSADHLFLHCSWVMHFWTYVLHRFGVLWAQPDSIKNLLSCWPNRGLGVRPSLCRQMLYWCLQWFAGQYGRNAAEEFFMMHHGSTIKILDSILLRIYSWLFVDQQREDPTFRSWIFDWDSFIF